MATVKTNREQELSGLLAITLEELSGLLAITLESSVRAFDVVLPRNHTLDAACAFVSILAVTSKVSKKTFVSNLSNAYDMSKKEFRNRKSLFNMDDYDTYKTKEF